jgi:CRISPR-associated protein Cas2
MRNTYLIAYDVADDKRRTKIFKKLKGRGEAVQYSIFRCGLSPTEKLTLRTELWDLLNLEEDRLLLLDLGPEDGRGLEAWETWGKEVVDPANFSGPQIV